MRGGGCDDHILSDGRLHLSPFPPAPKEQVRSISISHTGNFDEVNVEMVKAGLFPNASEARDWSRYVLRQAGEQLSSDCYRLPGRPEPITITKKKGGRQLAA
jgi:hypothetical protein